MAQDSTLLSLPQMVDLALNMPEVGTVNFNILHTLLQVLIQQIEATNVNVEFRGKDSDRLQNLIGTQKTGSVINLTEYTVTDGGKERKMKKKKRKDSKRASEDKLISPKGSRNSMQTIFVVEPTPPNTDTPHFTIAITKSHIDQMQNEIKDLKQQMQELIDLPGNIGLIDAIRTEKSSPLLDMFQIINLTKRIDGLETAIEKLATMIEDLAKEGLKTVPTASIRTDSISTQSTIIEKAEEIRKSLSSSSSHVGILEKVENIEKRLGKLEDTLMSKEIETPDEDTNIKDTREASAEDVPPPAEEFSEEPIKECDLTKLSPAQAIAIIQKELENLRDLIEKSVSTKTESNNEEIDGEGDGDCLHRIMNLDQIYNNQFTLIQQRLDDVEREVNVSIEKINVQLSGGDNAVNEENVTELYEKFKQMQNDMLAFTETSLKLEEETEQRQKAVESLIEQIDLLKIVKANREDLEDALNDKADACAIERKVSQDQFNVVCDDLTKGIDDTLQKLSQQEELWQQTLEEIQKEIGSKLDKLELNTLRDFVTKKLKFLQDKFKRLSNLRDQTEAAGAHNKLLTNINCISCDKDVVMRTKMDPTLKPKPYSMPPPKNIAPYLAYELDQLRKQQKCLPNARNLNYFEKSIKEHRKCGGSHTITTPQQRVTRMGNFLDQWPSSKVDENFISIRTGQRNTELSDRINMSGSISVQKGFLIEKAEKDVEEIAKKLSVVKKSIVDVDGNKENTPRKSKESIQKRIMGSKASVIPIEPSIPEIVISSESEIKEGNNGKISKKSSQIGNGSQLQILRASGEIEKKISQQIGSKTIMTKEEIEQSRKSSQNIIGSQTEIRTNSDTDKKSTIG